jgi:NAD(P)-dependent dehydrogenase (short-subunit alcohol dehydrogenase family)
MGWYYITGCDTGFGNEVIKMLDAKGHNVIAGVFSKDSIAKVEASGKNIVGVQLDVSNDDSVAAAAQFVKAKVGDKGLDGVVNNAGILVTPGPVEWTPVESYKKMHDVNVLGGVRVTQSVLPMIRQARGRIVMVASIAGRIGLPSQPAYCASKYAVEAYSDVLRRDMYEWGVTVHIVEPGVFSTTNLYDAYQTGLDKLWEKCPEDIKKAYGQPYYEGFRKLLGRALHDMGNTDITLVPKAYVEALLDESPKYRYRVGVDSKYIIAGIERLHESTQDFMIRGDFIKSEVPPPATAPKDGRAMSYKRYSSPFYQRWYLVILFVLTVFLGRRSTKWF